MRRLPNYMPLLVVFVIIIILYFSLSTSPSKYEQELSSSELQLISGDVLDLKKFHGQYYIIHAFASWCEVCKDDFVFLKAMHEKTQVPIIGIAMNDKLGKLRLLNKEKWPYDYIAIDSEMKIARLIRSKAIPETIIINPNGRVILRYIGGLDKQAVDGKIIPLLMR